MITFLHAGAFARLFIFAALLAVASLTDL